MEAGVWDEHRWRTATGAALLKVNASATAKASDFNKAGRARSIDSSGIHAAQLNANL